MPNHLEQNMVNGRATKLRELSSSLSQNFYQKFLGERVEVLWEKDHDADGHLLGKTKNYLNVAGINSNQLPGSISQVVLKGFLRPQLLLGV
jgi:tRNA A37 methylthiotransferase MiaB